MKRSLFFIFAALLFSAVAFAGRTQTDIRTSTEGDISMPRSIPVAPVTCFYDKEAGYVELQFARNLGEVAVTITDSTGEVADQTVVDTATERFVVLNIFDADESYLIEIDGEKMSGEGYIE